MTAKKQKSNIMKELKDKLKFTAIMLAAWAAVLIFLVTLIKTH